MSGPHLESEYYVYDPIKKKKRNHFKDAFKHIFSGVNNVNVTICYQSIDYGEIPNVALIQTKSVGEVKSIFDVCEYISVKKIESKRHNMTEISGSEMMESNGTDDVGGNDETQEEIIGDLSSRSTVPTHTLPLLVAFVSLMICWWFNPANTLVS